VAAVEHIGDQVEVALSKRYALVLHLLLLWRRWDRGRCCDHSDRWDRRHNRAFAFNELYRRWQWLRLGLSATRSSAAMFSASPASRGAFFCGVAGATVASKFLLVAFILSA
jgi:hypothetical protein